ncbi:CD276 antigen-like isoform X2 [Brienomyrus brachyistius]|uniref:CD276 antigen-like isoform X2 n=1 Tax=Brienomyrus brachyistius TaxID=42636 RepID=UPI0020B35879|nr:CD276 antigen-like isoform X2 [Brienomyrus brachyistius]
MSFANRGLSFSPLDSFSVSLTGFVSLNCLQENRGLHGMDSVIQCWVKSGYPNVRIVAVVWRRLGLSPPLLSFIGGVLKQGPRFQLAEPRWDEGRAVVSLLVRATRVADEGLYHCLVLTDHGYAEKTAHLRVTARYTGLIVSSVPESNIQDKTAVEMFCNAQGGYPKGAIRWFDQYGTDWSRSAETVARETADGRFDIVSKFAVRRVSSASPRYRCCLLDGAGDKEAEVELRLSFAVPGQEKATAARRSYKAVTASVIVLGSLVCGFLVLVLLQRSESCAAVQFAVVGILT